MPKTIQNFEKKVFASGVDPLFVSFELIRLQDDPSNGRELVWRRSWGKINLK